MLVIFTLMLRFILRSSIPDDLLHQNSENREQTLCAPKPAASFGGPQTVLSSPSMCTKREMDIMVGCTEWLTFADAFHFALLSFAEGNAKYISQENVYFYVCNFQRVLSSFAFLFSPFNAAYI